MTKKDFELIARVIRAYSMAYGRDDRLALAFANALEGTNPRFKRDLFIQRATEG